MKIKDTNAECFLKEINVIDSIAYVTFIIASSKPASKNQGFQFYILDKDEIEPSLLSTNNYWIDRCNIYKQDASNVEINNYKEIKLKIDITNRSKAKMLKNRWIRPAYFLLKNIEQKTNEYSWKSPLIELVSKEIELPEIKDFSLYTDKQSYLRIEWRYVYESQADFNYANLNTYSQINIYAVTTNKLLETCKVANISHMNKKFIAKPFNKYHIPIFIEINLMNNNDYLLKSFKRYYKPCPQKFRTYIKLSNCIQPIRLLYLNPDDNWLYSYGGASLKTAEIPAPEVKLLTTGVYKELYIKVNKKYNTTTNIFLEGQIYCKTRDESVTFPIPSSLSDKEYIEVKVVQYLKRSLLLTSKTTIIKVYLSSVSDLLVIK